MYIAILIDGDNENTLGGACSRDIWNMIIKMMRELNIERQNIHTFFNNPTDRYTTKLRNFGITNIEHNSLQNIKKCFDGVVEQAKQAEATVFFHYSGHGYQVADNNGDEVDGMDEIFLGHQMRDDYIWDNLVAKLPSNAKLIGTMDACHSGSGMDLPYQWNGSQWILAKKNNIKADCVAYSFSACNDGQCASQDIGETTGFAGSLTAGVCDLLNLLELVNQPTEVYKKLSERLQKLGQIVELYTTLMPKPIRVESVKSSKRKGKK